MQIIGITCSTAAALFWSVAIILFNKSGDNFSPMALMGDVPHYKVLDRAELEYILR